MLQPPPLSLYVHLPWCVRKCPYCDFNSHAAPQQIPQAQYVAALLADLREDAELIADRTLISIFFGGGTPSLFAPEYVAQLLEGVGRTLKCAPNLEVTLEANPGTLEHGRFAGYRAAGVNRVSLGVQSFDDGQLHLLGRIHNTADAVRAVDELTGAGIDNFNLDLMYGLPRQTLDAALADVQSAIALSPTHISHYQLTLEPGTVFYHRPPPLPDTDESWDMQLACQSALARAGYRQYEVSAYARAGRECRHNLNYWQFGDYLGIGAGAHGKITASGRREILRTERLKHPREYLGLEPPQRVQRRKVELADRAFEFMLNALRVTDGFETREFEERTGLPATTIAPQLAAAHEKGLLMTTQQGWKPTELGRQFLNDLQAMFLANPGGEPTPRVALPQRG